MNHEELKQLFDGHRAHQVAKFGREMTPTDRAAGDVVFNAAVAAVEDVRLQRRDVSMRTVSLATGLGKSTSAYSFIAAATKLDSEFSAAYIVPTIRMGLEVQAGIEELLGEYTTTLWSTHHDPRRQDPEEAERDLGFVPTRLVEKLALKDSRIIIITHKLWQNEIKSGKDQGVRLWQCEPRQVLFVDEYPELVDIVSGLPQDVIAIHDELCKSNPEHPWLPVLVEASRRMAKTMQTNGQTYTTKRLVSKKAGEVFSNTTVTDIVDIMGEVDEYDQRRSLKGRYEEAAKMFETIRFLQAASCGCAFYSRQDCCFFAYKLDFEPGPGHVLLDATSDITGLVTLHPGVESVEVPEVDYGNLAVYHLDHPKKWNRVSKVVKRADTGEAYGKWIREVVLMNTESGDDVLVITHKDMVNLNFVPGAPDADNPADWEGRKVNTQTWGSGVGLNMFKHKTHVFTFGEFHRPRAATISVTHGWSKKPLNNGHLKNATGQRVTGDEFSPRGIYLEPHEGNLLRWTKQLAMRGCARTVDAEGKCKTMKLFTSMSRNRLLKHYERLFPGAEPPMQGKAPKQTTKGNRKQTKRPGKRDALVNLLMGREKSVYGADEVARVTGLPADKLLREFKVKVVQQAVSAYGWRFVSAKDIGRAGRMRYLVNDTMMTKEREAA